MTAFSFDPQKLLGDLTQGLTGLPLIIGLPSPQALTPNFVVGVTTEERVRTSNTLPGLQLTAGDLFLKSARNPGEYRVSIILSETQSVKNETIQTITKAVQQLSSLGSSFANYGGVLPNPPGFTSNFAVSQLQSLQAIKDGFQPILALNLFMPFSAFSTTNPYLESSWYISNIDPVKAESERGAVVEITFRELLLKRDTELSLSNVFANIANELTGTAVGSSIGSLL